MLLIQLSTSHSIYVEGYTALGAYMVGKGLLFKVVFSNDTVNSKSVVGVKPGDSGVVIGYQVDEFTCLWSVECFVAWLHIYPGFMGKVSALTCFPLEPGCEDYSFLD